MTPQPGAPGNDPEEIDVTEIVQRLEALESGAKSDAQKIEQLTVRVGDLETFARELGED